MIEMFNALNALSDESSILTVGIFANPLLLIAMTLSIGLHCVICYLPFFENIFGTVALTTNDWLLVLAFSLPVVLLDEFLKVIVRGRTKKELEARMAEIKKHQ